MKVTKRPFAFVLDTDAIVKSPKINRLSPKTRGVLLSVIAEYHKQHRTDMRGFGFIYTVLKPAEFARLINISNYQLQDFITELVKTGTVTVNNDDMLIFNY